MWIWSLGHSKDDANWVSIYEQPWWAYLTEHFAGGHLCRYGWTYSVGNWLVGWADDRCSEVRRFPVDAAAYEQISRVVLDEDDPADSTGGSDTQEPTR